MPKQLKIVIHTSRWLVIACLVGTLSGSASAVFLISLEWATQFRENHIWLIALLPLGGFAVGFLYDQIGRSVEAGTNLVIDEIHKPRATIAVRMAPLVFIGTIVTHYFGGSAGREGTALQMGASLSDQLRILLKRDDEEGRKTLLMAGLSAGFASVFGTPLAGAVFGLEVLTIGRMNYSAIFPCFIAAVVGDLVTHHLGVHHTVYSISVIPSLTILGLFCAIVAGICFGTIGMLFAKSTHLIATQFKKFIPYPPFRPLVGGVLIATLVGVLGSTKYIGLGIPTIIESFQMPVPPWDFAGKFLFTVLTLGAGFKGGEVTPLFFIGATLGNALSNILPLSPSLLTGMGFVAVFAGAANTPLSSILMAFELFGSESGVFMAIGCVVSYLFSGPRGIYSVQRVVHCKSQFSRNNA